jgi:hypothetical protein
VRQDDAMAATSQQDFTRRQRRRRKSPDPAFSASGKAFFEIGSFAAMSFRSGRSAMSKRGPSRFTYELIIRI